MTRGDEGGDGEGFCRAGVTASSVYFRDVDVEVDGPGRHPKGNTLHYPHHCTPGKLSHLTFSLHWSVSIFFTYFFRHAKMHFIVLLSCVFVLVFVVGRGWLLYTLSHSAGIMGVNGMLVRIYRCYQSFILHIHARIHTYTHAINHVGCMIELHTLSHINYNVA